MRITAAAIAMLAMAAAGAGAQAQPRGEAQAGNRAMLNCLAQPSEQTASAFAATARATAVNAQDRLGATPPRVYPDAGRPGQSIRSQTTATAARRWTMDGGDISYLEETITRAQIDARTGRVLRALPGERNRACVISGDVDDASYYLPRMRGFLGEPYQMLLAGGGRVVAFVALHPGRYDFDVSFQFDQPVAIRLPSVQSSAYGLRITDGGDEILPPGNDLPGATATRAQLAQVLRGPARMVISNTTIAFIPAPGPARR